ncbi:hypothetical protein Taro_014349 [Colocasia esculenta]|uniref:RING-type E3 ubiquitin transferase n=1 Tax=Colocasia esculenta TaxID=4460 RepID=A0A843UEL4_COLES|nr:hypothetical protein [Colocasia esculenta]
MASSGHPGAGAASAVAVAAAAAQHYFCHQCNRTVSLTPSPTAELACPICDGGFLEEIEPPLPVPSPNPSAFFPFSDSFALPVPFPFVLSGSSYAGPHGGDGTTAVNVEDVLGAFAGPGLPRSGYIDDDFDALNTTFQFVQSRLQDLIAGGANVQFVIENYPSGGDFHFPRGAVSLGDYFMGPGLEQLIQQLAENDPNRYGTPPASKSAVEGLLEIKITQELLASDDAQCAVCKDSFEVGTEAKQMPCKHIYHKDCILPWLELHNSCPVCRYELPTDDPDYEQRMRGTPSPQAHRGAAAGSDSSRVDFRSESVAGEGNSPGAWAGERTMRISLPWSIRSLFGMGNAGGNGDSSSGAGDGNSGGRGGQNSGTETRQEDLD